MMHLMAKHAGTAMAVALVVTTLGVTWVVFG